MGASSRSMRAARTATARRVRGAHRGGSAAACRSIRTPGPPSRTRRRSAIDKVRYAGDPIAAVAAVDRDTAEEALELIDVEIEELPAVFDVRVGHGPGAPLICERLVPAQDLRRPDRADRRGRRAGHEQRLLPLQAAPRRRGRGPAAALIASSSTRSRTRRRSTADLESHCTIAQVGSAGPAADLVGDAEPVVRPHHALEHVPPARVARAGDGAVPGRWVRQQALHEVRADRRASWRRRRSGR